jgi:ArsR family transcriptional regulator
MQRPFDSMLDELRAAAEPSRLRLLAVLFEGEFSVTELTEVVGQSQPRVSRHLKLLCDAGLLEKFREQHWIFYRVPAEGHGRDLVGALLARIERDDATLEADRLRVEAILEQRRNAAPASPVGTVSGDDRELAAALVEELGDPARGALFYFGRSPTEVLGVLARHARRVVGMHESRLEVQRARAVLHARGLNHCVLQQGTLRSLPQPSGHFDAIVLDRALASLPRPVDALREASRLGRPGSDVMVAEDYEALAQLAGTANPLALLKAWLADAGLACARLRPLDLDGRHVVVAVARADDGRVEAAA